MNMTEIQLEDISVMRVVAKGGPSGARAAFDELESKLPSLRGRKFYGTYHEGEYRACVAMNEGDSPHAMELITWVIPGGRYLREKVDDWEQKVEHSLQYLNRWQAPIKSTTPDQAWRSTEVRESCCSCCR